ncbi:hypothetical protein GWK87_06910 [Staphylococcus schleiferi subsp. coagulans]|uniref:hypothetical protein n=1 Tax=Staphylococcus coagulans TaxID=74706 RepID=UPI0015F90588|nr:hypothetical protein [Staphylococcus coagulans]MBA8760026.1 hypothetical protein [Staphylococcus coagulans]MBA8768535.1 hypothetical protein [Staphylococcus coagulans]
MKQHEVVEVKNAVEDALVEVQKVKKLIKEIRIWSGVDLLGNSSINSYFKRRKIKKMNTYLSQLQTQLQNTVPMLKDMDEDLVLAISNSEKDQLYDIWWDNIFTDVEVHGKIKKVKKSIEQLEIALNRILASLN